MISHTSASPERMITPELPVLIVDDDQDILEMLSGAFSKAGDFLVSTALDGQAALSKARGELPRLIILDLMLPKMPGLEVAKILKCDSDTRHIPIMMLTAKAAEVDRILGFELGASDYVTKPFSPREVVLRARSILNRNGSARVDRTLQLGNITVDVTAHSVLVDRVSVRLTMVEFKLLTKFMESPKRVFSRQQLLSDVWGYHRTIDTRTVDTHIRRLRFKLGKSGDIIETIRGFGYRIRDIYLV